MQVFLAPGIAHVHGCALAVALLQKGDKVISVASRAFGFQQRLGRHSNPPGEHFGDGASVDSGAVRGADLAADTEADDRLRARVKGGLVGLGEFAGRGCRGRRQLALAVHPGEQSGIVYVHTRLKGLPPKVDSDGHLLPVPQ